MWNYSRAGVDIKKIRKIQTDIGKLVSKTHFAFENRSWNVWSGFGHYAGLIEFQSMVFAYTLMGLEPKSLLDN